MASRSIGRSADFAQFRFSRAQQPSSRIVGEAQHFVARRQRPSAPARMSRHTFNVPPQRFSTRSCERAQGGGLSDEQSTFPMRDMISARNRELQPNAARGRHSWHAK